jgi:WD40 repeat protein
MLQETNRPAFFKWRFAIVRLLLVIATSTVFVGFPIESVAQKGLLLKGDERRILDGPIPFPNSVVFSPDGKLVACSYGGTGGGSVMVWQVETGKEVAKLDLFDGGIACLAFSPDGKSLATAGFQEPARLFDTTSWKVRGGLPKECGNTRFIAFSRDGTMLVTVNMRGSFSFWDPKTFKALPELGGETIADLCPMAFSPDGKLLAGGGWKTAVIWDVAARKARATLEGIKARVCAVAIAPDGTTLVTVEGDLLERNVRLWDPETGKLKYKLDVGEKYTQTLGAAFSPDSKTLVVTGVGFIHLWDVATGKHRHEMKVNDIVHCVAWSPTGETIAVALRDGSVRLFDVPKDK